MDGAALLKTAMMQYESENEDIDLDGKKKYLHNIQIYVLYFIFPSSEVVGVKTLSICQCLQWQFYYVQSSILSDRLFRISVTTVTV